MAYNNVFFYPPDGESATFEGSGRITYDISGEGQYAQTREDNLKMRFRTNQADSVLLYADGNQGDFYILEMMRGRLYFHIDLGKFKVCTVLSLVSTAPLTLCSFSVESSAYTGKYGIYIVFSLGRKEIYTP